MLSLYNAMRAREMRPYGRLNEDDTISTHLMADDDITRAYPSLFMTDKGWQEIDEEEATQREAIKRNEMLYFDTPKEMKNFARGSLLGTQGNWKQSPIYGLMKSLGIK